MQVFSQTIVKYACCYVFISNWKLIVTFIIRNFHYVNSFICNYADVLLLILWARHMKSLIPSKEYEFFHEMKSYLKSYYVNLAMKFFWKRESTETCNCEPQLFMCFLFKYFKFPLRPTSYINFVVKRMTHITPFNIYYYIWYIQYVCYQSAVVSNDVRLLFVVNCSNCL